MFGGKLALVTGGGSGIGRAVCQLLAKEGAKVVVSDIDLATAENTVSVLYGSDHLPLKLDVSNTEQISDVLAAILSRYSAPPTVLVNSAGITRDAFLLKMMPDQFSQVLDVNLKGTFAMTQAICQALVTNKKSGSVVNIASIVGQIGNMGQCNYAASKAGVEAFTKTVAKEMGVHGIRCNAVVPGFITSPMTDRVPDKVKDMFKAQIPLGRLGMPEVLLQIFGTVPVTTSTAERSFSTLKRLKSYLRTTMGEPRLNGLALANIHKDRQINVDEIINSFSIQKQRRMAMAN